MRTLKQTKAYTDMVSKLLFTESNLHFVLNLFTQMNIVSLFNISIVVYSNPVQLIVPLCQHTVKK